MITKGTIAGTGHTKFFQHSGDGDRVSCGLGCFHLGSNFDVDCRCQFFPRMLMAFFKTSSAS